MPVSETIRLPWLVNMLPIGAPQSLTSAPRGSQPHWPRRLRAGSCRTRLPYRPRANSWKLNRCTHHRPWIGADLPCSLLSPVRRCWIGYAPSTRTGRGARRLLHKPPLVAESLSSGRRDPNAAERNVILRCRQVKLRRKRIPHWPPRDAHGFIQWKRPAWLNPMPVPVGRGLCIARTAAKSFVMGNRKPRCMNRKSIPMKYAFPWASVLQHRCGTASAPAGLARN